MATKNRRFFYKGPWPADMKAATDPGLTLPAPKFVVSYDIAFDDSVADAASVDERMKRWGCFPDTQNTVTRAVDPFLGLISPDGGIWRLQVSDLGILTVDKVSS